MLAMALKPFGVRSFVGLMKLPAALLTSPVSGPPSSQIRCTMASTAAASRMSTECVRTRPPCWSINSLAVSSSTAPRRPASHRSAPSSRYLAAISLPRPVPPPVMRMRLPLNRFSLNMRAPGRGARILSRDLLLGGGVGGLAQAEGPVFLRHLDEVDPRVLAAQAQGGEVVGNAAEEGALLRQGPAEADGDLHDHDVIRASDAEIARVVDQVAGLVLAQELEAVELRHTDRLDQRAVDRIAQLAAEIRRPALAQRDSHQGHGTSCRGEPRASARRAASWAARSALRTAG